jgi:hypothetical protein
VPFVRFSRDKRGYEHLYLVQPASQRRGRPNARVLYWFRTPPNIRVGRRAFDEFARRELERRYPEVTFDWEALANTPIPPPSADVERWRERRRQERAARQAARAEAEAAAVPEEPDVAAPLEETRAPEAEGEGERPMLPRSAAEAAIEAAQADRQASETPAAASEEVEQAAQVPSSGPAVSARGPRRRRRRRHRGSRGSQAPGPARE